MRQSWKIIAAVATVAAALILAAFLLLPRAPAGRQANRLVPVAAPAQPLHTATKAVLLSGFEPFGGGTLNASWEAVRRLEGWRPSGYTVKTLLLPVAWEEAGRLLTAEAERTGVAVVIAFGQGRDDAVYVERIARNRRGSFPDNRGMLPAAFEIVAGGSTAYPSTLPCEKILMALRVAGIPEKHSYDAGDYLCNETFYRLMRWCSGRADAPAAGLVHLPPVGSRFLSADGAFDLDTLERAVRTVVEATIPAASAALR